jgi:hypothetical protein
LEELEALFQLRDNGNDLDFLSPVLFAPVSINPSCLIPGEFDLVPVKGNFTVRT